MKKILLIAIMAFGLLFFVACGEEGQADEGPADEEFAIGEENGDDDENGEEAENGMYADGVYTGTGEGYNGDILVTVTIEDGEITSVIVDEHEETEAIAEPAFESLASRVIANQGTEGVDAETGATGSSQGFLEAVENALEDAR